MTREEWEAKQNSLKKDVRYMPTGNPGEVKMVESGSTTEEKDGNPPVDDKTLKSDWNKYLEYLEKKGVKGSANLDKGGLGNKYFLEYIKANPGTSLSVDVIPRVRQLYIDLRNTNIEQMKKGNASFSPGGIVGNKATGNSITGATGDYTEFMKNIIENEKTANPNYVGRYLTQTRFPEILDYEGKPIVETYEPKQAINLNATVDSAIEAKKKNINLVKKSNL